MLTQQFIDEIDIIYNNLNERYASHNQTEQEGVFSKAIKLNEEVGELCKEVLHKYYKRRVDSFDEKNLELEFADVILTTLLLAKSLNIDVNKTFQNKINIIKNRGGV